jgi:hypothetical protein
MAADSFLLYRGDNSIAPLDMPLEPLWEARYGDAQEGTLAKPARSKSRSLKAPAVDITRLSMNAAAHLRVRAAARQEQEEEEEEQEEEEEEVAEVQDDEEERGRVESRPRSRGQPTVDATGDVSLRHMDTVLDFGEIKSSSRSGSTSGAIAKAVSNTKSRKNEEEEGEAENVKEIDELSKTAMGGGLTLTFTQKNMKALAEASAVVNRESKAERETKGRPRVVEKDAKGKARVEEGVKAKAKVERKAATSAAGARPAVKPKSIEESRVIAETKLKEMGPPKTIARSAGPQKRVPQEPTSSPRQVTLPEPPPFVDNIDEDTALPSAEPLLFHASDRSVKPLVGNAKIEKLPPIKIKADANGLMKGLFRPAKAEELLEMEQAALEQHLTSVYKVTFRILVTQINM